ncbi:unnamed protein product [Linum tenue]|uniref:Bet v I/Major latex protein domain-containing protein n=1 Tax=Linum tenue TaxID=586396 RepID=A0AAV0Q4H7_9ROSI|nr:unnamed protein product [Linum tenue]
MAIFSFEAEVTTSIPPAKMFKAFVVDGEKIAAQIFPEAIKSVASEGDGGPGTIKQVHFNEGSPFKFVKEVVDELDKEKLIYGYTVIGGDALMAGVEKISYRFKMEESADGGTICKRSSKFFTSEEGGIGEDEVKAANEGMWQMFCAIFKAFEGHLLANPSS